MTKAQNNETDFLSSTIYRYASKSRWPLFRHFLGTRKGKAMLLKFPLCLSFILVQRPPKRIVKMILKIDPDAVLRKNERGMLPIHVACRYGASSEMIKTLISSDKTRGGRSAVVADSKLNTPLHYLVQYLSDPLSVDNAESTRRRESESISGTCSLLTQTDFEDSLLSIEQLVSIAPMAVFHKNRRRKTVLDLLIYQLEHNYTKGSTCDWERILAIVNRIVEVSPETEHLQNMRSHDDDETTHCSSLPESIGNADHENRVGKNLNSSKMGNFTKRCRLFRSYLRRRGNVSYEEEL